MNKFDLKWLVLDVISVQSLFLVLANCGRLMHLFEIFLQCWGKKYDRYHETCGCVTNTARNVDTISLAVKSAFQFNCPITLRNGKVGYNNNSNSNNNFNAVIVCQFGDLQWGYNHDLAKLGGEPPLNQVVEDLYR